MFWCLSGSLPEAYDVSPCGRMPAGGYVFRGAGRPAGGNGMAGLGAPHPDMREGIYAGFHPAPHLGFFFGKKNPKDPKKPNWVR